MIGGTKIHYLILLAVLFIGFIAMGISYFKTDVNSNTKMSSKLIDDDISLEEAIEELELVNESNNLKSNKFNDERR